jgi:hypothetical protein
MCFSHGKNETQTTFPKPCTTFQMKSETFDLGDGAPAGEKVRECRFMQMSSYRARVGVIFVCQRKRHRRRYTRDPINSRHRAMFC